MTRKRLAITLAKLISRDLDSPKALRQLALHVADDLQLIAGYIEKLESEIEELKKENNLLLAEFDKQELFPFIRIEEPTRNPPGTHPEPTIFKVVGED